MTNVVVIDTGCANLASVIAAFRRLTVDVNIAVSAQTVRDAARVVLPGVGAFGPAMQRLDSTGMAIALYERVQAERPLLAICLGMHLLADASAEAPGVAGLGLVHGRARPFDTVGVRVPQMGWNRIVPPPRAETFLRDGFAYFANSYYLPSPPPGPEWRVTTATHGVSFAAALERGPLLACQFHPELSGAWGAALLRRWCDQC